MYEEAHPKVLAIIRRNIRVENLMIKQPQLLQVLNVAASQSVSKVMGGRWEPYESLKKTYIKVLESSAAKSKLSREEHEVLITAIDELLPVLSTRDILELEFAEPLYDEYGQEL